jgi:membrane protease YdiL (CAAX protease family)
MTGIVKRYPVAAFYIVALLLGSIFSAPFIAATIRGTTPKVPVQILFIAASSASLSAIIVTGVISGWAGIKKLLARFLIWRVGLQWWATVLILPLVWWLLAALLNSLFGGTALDASNFQSLSFLIPFFVLRMITAGLGEEYGWRGFALPRLQSRHNALVAAIIVGVLHGLWHWPMYFIGGFNLSQYALQVEIGFLPAILLETLMVTLWSIVYAWFYNNTKGSVLIAGVFHSGIPLWAVFFGIVGEGVGINLPVQIWYIGIVALTVVVIVAIYGPAHLSRKAERQMA